MQTTRGSVGMQTTGGIVVTSTNGEIVEEGPADHVITVEESDVGLLADMQQSLAKSRRGLTAANSRATIFKLPQNLAGIDFRAQGPEIVSIGPYHWGKDGLSEFEADKWCFLKSLTLRTNEHGVGLGDYLQAMKVLELDARRCYSEIVPMSSDEFVKMMVFDGCFIIELLHSISDNSDHQIIFETPWLIPILTRDLLKLENQLPFFVLQRLFDLSNGPSNQEGRDPLNMLAFKFFNYALPRPLDVLKNSCQFPCIAHLLHLFYVSFVTVLPRPELRLSRGNRLYPPLDQSIQSVTQLRLSGIKFRPRTANSFLDIKFIGGRRLEIPQITVNDFAGTVFVNCVAWEQGCEQGPDIFTLSSSGDFRLVKKWGPCFASYLAFMSCLVNSSRDVGLLCADGIITNYSESEQYVARFFNELGKNVAFRAEDSYLSEQLKQVDEYYSSYFATMMRTYFRSPWTFISVKYGIILLVLTLIQTIVAVQSSKIHFSKNIMLLFTLPFIFIVYLYVTVRCTLKFGNLF